MSTPAPVSPESRPRRRSSVRKSPPRPPPSPPVANVFSWAPESRSRFVELVALQSLFPTIPSEPIDRATKLKEWEHEKLPGWRLLPGKAEREVADNFAFLAAADSRQEFISAVCIEERRGGGMTFRLAMNDGDLNEGVPRGIVDRLNEICKELEAAAMAEGQSDRKSRETVWQKVLDLEAPKIVKDLKQKFKRASKSLHELFREALAQKKRLAYNASRANSELSLLSAVTTQTDSGQADTGALLAKIYDQCQDVVNKDGGSNSRDEVERLLDTCYVARRSRNFRTFLNSIEIRKQLVQTIDTLGQYKSASNSLVSHAKKHPDAFRTIEIQTISPPVRESFALPEHSDTGLATLASHLCGTSTEEANQKLKTLTGLPGPKLLTQYEELYLSRPSIHAEIQLVKFYEENPSINPPKFIGSSKKTCYLCNLFLERHGRFAVSKSSQNLYPRWTVPTIVCSSSTDVDRYKQVVQQMTSLLEDSCTISLSQKEGTARRNSASIPTTPVLAAQSFSNLNASLRLRGSKKHRSAIGSGKENTFGTVTSRTKARMSDLPAAAPQQSVQKVQDWTVSGPRSPEKTPLSPSVRHSRISTPIPGSRPSILRVPLSPPEEVGGVSLFAQPTSPTSTRRNTPRHLDAAVQGPASMRSKKSKETRTKEKRHSAIPATLTDPTGSSSTVDGAATGVASMDVQISKGRDRTPSPPQNPHDPSTPNSSQSKVKSTDVSTPTTVKSTDTRTATTSATSTSIPPTPTPEAREKRRLEKGKFRATTNSPRPRTPLGALNLTIERHATPPSSPVKTKQAHWLDSPKPPAKVVEKPETEYTIYLAGNYSEGLSLGDAVFSGKLSDVNKKGEIMQCRGFRLRSGLRKKKAENNSNKPAAAGKKEAPLRVHEVVKTSEMMVIDIIFPDAVVRMEVFWDEEARSVI